MGDVDKVSLHFNVAPTAIHNIFQRRQESLAAGNVVADVAGQKRGQVGRKKRLLDLEVVKAIPLL